MPRGTLHTVSSGSRQVFRLLFLRTTFRSMRFRRFTFTSSPGSANERIPPLFPRAVLWSSRMPALFSISNPLTLPAAVLWSTRATRDCPM